MFDKRKHFLEKRKVLSGLLVGTFSSVFMASPILMVWQRKTGGALIYDDEMREVNHRRIFTFKG